MTFTQTIRQQLAESGIEKTPEEIALIIKTYEDLVEGVSYEDYIMYKSMDDEGVRNIASSFHVSYKKAKFMVSTVVRIGKMKYGEL